MWKEAQEIPEGRLRCMPFLPECNNILIRCCHLQDGSDLKV